jgi:hypothetical protein
MSTYRALAAIFVLAAAAACGTGGGDATGVAASSATTPSQEPTSNAATTPGDDPTDGVPAFPGTTADQTAENSGEWDLVLMDVRVAEHGSFDRVVLEFAGTGTPGWAVNYVAEAVLDGSGEAVTLDGDAILDIYASGTTWSGSEEDHYSGPRRFEPENGDAVTAVHVGGTFEGYTQVLVGIDGGPLPFRAFALTDPSRLVVDVVDDSAD